MANGRLHSALSQMPRFALIILALLVPLNAFLPVSRIIDRSLVDLRFSTFQRDASQQIVFIAIDKASLDKVGVWPWPRGIYADVLTVLSRSEPKDIFFDIDFSTPSSSQQDGKLAEALQKAGGGVILPVFKQIAKAGEPSGVELTKPIEVFANAAWPAFANIELDNAGLVSRFATADYAEGRRIQSAPAVLSGYQGKDDFFPIDYSIQPATIPTYSVSDILAGKVPSSRLDGKTIVVGAFATELKDIYPVPVHGVIAGPLIHILAAETILQNRMLASVNQLPLELLLAASAIALALAARRLSISTALAGLVVTITCLEALALWLQHSQGFLLETADSWLILMLALCLFVSEKFDFTRFLLRRASADRHLARTVLHQIIAESSDAVVFFDENLSIIEASETSYSLLQQTGVWHRQLDDAVPPRLKSAVEKLAASYRERPGQTLAKTFQFSTGEGPRVQHFEATLTISPRVIHLETGRTDKSSFVGSLIVRDQTAQRNYEHELLRLSQIDELTGLLNRREFASRLGLGGSAAIIAAIGFYRYEVLTKILGSTRSDALLLAISERLRVLPSISLIGRLGQDTFVVAIPGEDESALERIAQSVAGLFEGTVDLGGSAISLDVRVGLYRKKPTDEQPSHCIDYSAVALESACEVNSHWWREYDPQLAARQERARKLEHDMRDGLRRGEFYLLYQPQVDLKTGILVGAEALLRWNHREAGQVSPAEFIPVAEASGFIRELGRFALKEACRAASEWPSHMTVAVNVSGIQMQDFGLVDEVGQALEESGLEPFRLHLEITESAFVEGSKAVLDLIELLRDLGISIALDDFGTGYSSLSYITSMHLDKIKIDQSFVKRLAGDPRASVVVQSILLLTQGLRLKAIAEGIETLQEWEILHAMGCQEGQGYLFGRPMSSRDLLKCQQIRVPHSRVDVLNRTGFAGVHFV